MLADAELSARSEHIKRSSRALVAVENTLTIALVGMQIQHGYSDYLYGTHS